MENKKMSEPEYYNGNGLSPLRALLSKDEFIGFCKGNVIKYTVRAGKKDNAIKDIDKAIDYLNHLKNCYKYKAKLPKIEPDIECPYGVDEEKILAMWGVNEDYENE